MNILFWDIDGTLLNTGRAGLYAIEEAFSELQGKKVTVPPIAAGGRTDNYICQQLLFKATGKMPAHAAIRPVLTTAEEAAAAPAGFKVAPKAKSGKEYGVTIVVSQLDCLECGSCANVCPVKALTMVQNDDAQIAKMDQWYYAMDKVAPKPNPQNKKSVIGSQLETPLLEFSGA